MQKQSHNSRFSKDKYDVMCLSMVACPCVETSPACQLGIGINFMTHRRYQCLGTYQQTLCICSLTYRTMKQIAKSSLINRRCGTCNDKDYQCCIQYLIVCEIYNTSTYQRLFFSFAQLFLTSHIYTRPIVTIFGRYPSSTCSRHAQ